MIGKAKSIGHGGRGIDYALNKDQAQIIDQVGISGTNGNEVAQEFATFQDLNSRAQNKEISIVLSPEIEDGKSLSISQWREIGKDFMNEMELNENQYIAILHKDREHQHLHIFANRIDYNGKCYDDKYIGKKAQRKAEDVAQKHGLTLASNVEALNKANTKQIKAEMKQIHDRVMKEGRPQNFGEYMQLMKANNVEIKPTINKQGKVQGFRMERFGQNFKASEVHRSIGLKKMINTATCPSLSLKTAKIALNVAKKVVRLGMKL